MTTLKTQRSKGGKNYDDSKKFWLAKTCLLRPTLPPHLRGIDEGSKMKEDQMEKKALEMRAKSSLESSQGFGLGRMQAAWVLGQGRWRALAGKCGGHADAGSKAKVKA